VAIRIRNGSSGDWSDWLPFDPDIGSEAIKLDHDLTRGSGIKTVQFQVATPAGLAPTATMEVVADFKPIVHQVNFYKPLGDCSTGTPCPPDPIETSHLEESGIWVEDNKLNVMDNIPIASVRAPETETSEDNVKELVVRESDYIFIEIIPEESYFDQFTQEEIEEKNITPTFDFIHQGGQDGFNLPTIFNLASRSFRGWISINKEDEGAFRDGLAYIVVHFKNDCSDPTSVSAGSVTEKLAAYTKDEFNALAPGNATFNTEQTDVWASDRDNAGKIESKIVIRPSEDPYFIFGDPNYRLRENE